MLGISSYEGSNTLQFIATYKRHMEQASVCQLAHNQLQACSFFYPFFPPQREAILNFQKTKQDIKGIFFLSSFFFSPFQLQLQHQKKGDPARNFPVKQISWPPRKKKKKNSSPGTKIMKMYHIPLSPSPSKLNLLTCFQENHK